MGFDGISANLNNPGATGDISITANGAVREGAMASRVHNAGSGTTTITASNSVTATAGSGIFAQLDNPDATGDLEITTTGAVTGQLGRTMASLSRMRAVEQRLSLPPIVSPQPMVPVFSQ